MRKLSLVLSMLLLVSAALCGPALAAQDVTDWVYEYLTTDVAYISLYEPTEKRIPLGEMIFNDLSQAVEMAFGAGNVVPVKSLELADMPAQAESEEEEAPEEEVSAADPVVPEGYVLVSLRCEDREEILACMPEEFAQSPAQRRAEEEAAEAAEAELIGEEEAPEEPESTPEPLPAPAEEPEAEQEDTQPQEKKALFSRLSRRELILVLAALLILFAALGELALLLVYRRRAENLAKSYLRLKGQADKMKRELAAAKNSRMQMDRELVKLRGQMAGLEEKEEPAPSREERPADGGFILPDYADWKF